VARQRAQAGRALLAAYPQTDLIVCDDGLQHRALQHDLSICVFDERGVGNGWMLPAGPLRERSAAVTWTLFNGAPREVPVTASQGAHSLRRQLADHALRADGSRLPLRELLGKPVHALAGVARPDAFFSMLEQAGLTLARTSALPDHHVFGSDDFPAERSPWLVCTEKDAVKLWKTAPHALAVPLRVDLPTSLLHSLDSQLQKWRARPL
jgi:tetraacyldisaccharide 4'-kinase